MKKFLPLVVLIATLTFVLSPLASTVFNGFTPNQFPVVQNDPPVQPAGYAFSIWGLIFTWLMVGAGYGFWRASDDPGWQAMRLPLAASLIIGTFWIAAANTAPILATVMIIAMAVLAILAVLRAGHRQPWFQVRPVALYAGWLTAASGVGIGVLLGGYAILSAQSAATLCLIGVLVVALTVQSARPREWGYPAAVVWALVGVIVQNLTTSNWTVIILAAFSIVALISRTLFSVMKGPST
ncbi:MAG: hypothetical protein ACRBBQ_06680 [Cognatishimia sp.]